MTNYLPEGLLLNTSENKLAARGLVALTESTRTQKIIEGRAVLCDNAKNLIVDLGEIKGVIPFEEGVFTLDDAPVRDIALISRVGKPVCFTVSKIEGNTAILSRKKAQRLCYENKISLLGEGDVVDCRVTHLEPFGAFCDIGCGIVSLLPIDAISVSRISHPSDRFYVTQDIKAVVRQILPDGRICLSHKELLGTWHENAQLFLAGQTVSGIIRSIEEYGIFVELAPNLAGLAERKEGLCEGQAVSVYIKSINPERLKIKLIIVDSNLEVPPVSPCKYFVSRERVSDWIYK